MKIRAALNSPAAAAAIVVVCYGIFVLELWNARDRDISRFIVVGANAVDRARLPAGIALLPDSAGYDGTSFYRLALDPFTRTATDFGITLDMPAYRHQRILYPFLVWAFSLGHREAVPTLLVLVNIAAIAMLGASGAVLALHFGRHALWGTVFALYPGFVHSVSRDLSEPLACALALAAIVAVTKQRHLLGALMLCGAILARETFLLLAIAYGVAYVWSRVRQTEVANVTPVVFMAPLVLYAVWHWILAANWGVSPLRAGAHHIDLTVPFADYWNILRDASSLRRIHRLHFSEGLYLGIVALVVVAAWMRSKLPLPWRIGWIGYLIVASTLLHGIWGEDVSYMRVLSDFYLLSASIVVVAGGTLHRWILWVATAALWYYLATHLIRYG